MDRQEAHDIRDRQRREPGGLDFTTSDCDKKFSQPSPPAAWPGVRPATRRGPALPDKWRLHNVPDVVWQQDPCGIACIINWLLPEDIVRIDLMDEAVADGRRAIVSFQGKADNVRKHTMQWLAKYVPSFGLDHAAYIGAELERADTERIDYVQDGKARQAWTDAEAMADADAVIEARRLAAEE